MPTIAEIHQEAQQAAAHATAAYLAEYGDRDSCGFAWVLIYGVKLSTRLGKELKAVGFKKSYEGPLQLWNPSGSYTQCITAKEEGARAYCNVFKKYYPDMEIYPGSRLD